MEQAGVLGKGASSGMSATAEDCCLNNPGVPNEESADLLQSNVISATPIQVVKPTMRLLNSLPLKGSNDSPQNASNAQAATVPNCTKTLVAKGDQYPVKSQSDDNNNESTNSNDENEPEGKTEEEPDFDWNEYLDLTGATSAPPTSFVHVENSLQNMYSEGMKLEVVNRECSGKYWIASIMMTCGPLLRLRYEGLGGDMSHDFWCDIATRDVHPLGWCAENGRVLEPPPEVGQLCENWSEILERCRLGFNTVPAYLLEANGCTAVAQIKQGIKLEVQESLQPNHVWIATVLENVGGRLLLRYDGVSSNCHDFWLFYLSYQVHPVGWAKENDCEYRPPTVMASNRSVKDWDSILKDSLEAASKMPVPPVIFKYQETTEPHDFQEGMKLEAIDPSSPKDILPATVTRVLNPYFFLVQVDPPFLCDPGTRSQPFCCHAQSPNIFPVGWARSSGIRIPHPRGFIGGQTEFDWDDYLEHCTKKYGSVKRAPEYLFNMSSDEHGIEAEMKLEAVNPFQLHQICAATVVRVVGHLLWIRLDYLHGMHQNHIVPVTSHDLFPVGWCESNHYPLKVPVATYQQQGTGVKRPAKKVAIVMPKKQKRKLEVAEEPNVDFAKAGANDGQATKKAWCPAIYINHRCFSGPFLSKSRIAGLPRVVGPGPVTLVLREVISMLVNVSYLPSRVLSVLQVHGEATPGMQQHLIKAKYKSRSYRAMVEIIRSSEKVDTFCRSVCRKLQCCQNLISPESVGDNCSENCYTLTKTNKSAVMRRGRRRRKPHHRSLAMRHLLAQKEAAAAAAREAEERSEVASNGTKEEEEEAEAKPPREKRKYVHRVLPKSDIVTRGAKLPNFALELRRRHRKNAVRMHQTLPRPAAHREAPQQQPTSSESSSVSGVDGISSLTVVPSHPKRLGTDVKPEKTVLSAQSSSISKPECQAKHSTQETLQLDSNPLHWTIGDVADYMKTTDCAQMTHILKDQEIDGQALLLLTLPTIQEYLELKLGPAIKLCHHIERIKMAFYSQFAE